MNIAIFADLHGRILLAFKLCARWQKEMGQNIHLILQAGDLGAYPSRETLDRATLRYSAVDPTELGFMQDFVRYDAEVASVLNELHCNLVFVRGNHEAHAWLDNLEQQSEKDEPLFSIDAYQRIYCLKTGVPYWFQSGNETISVLGIGRIGAPFNEREDDKPQYIQQYEKVRLSTLRNFEPNVLLTHHAALDFISPGSGMAEIREALNRYEPSFHFFGHYGGLCRRSTDSNGVTHSCKLADLHWGKAARAPVLEEAAMGMLRWNGPEDHEFEVVEEKWMKEYGPQTWREV